MGHAHGPTQQASPLRRCARNRRGIIAQYVGRLHRLHEGKHEVRVYDADLNEPMLSEEGSPQNRNLPVNPDSSELYHRAGVLECSGKISSALLRCSSWTTGKSLQFGNVTLTKGKFFGSGPPLDLAFTLNGGRTIRMRFPLQKLDRCGKRSGSAASAGLMFSEAAGEIVR